MMTRTSLLAVLMATLASPALAQDGAAPISTADDLLAALETADKDIRSLQADLLYTKKPNELVGGSPEVRRGELVFRTDEPVATAEKPRKLFHIDFKTLELDDTRRDEPQTWIFDGEWLVEKNFETRMVHRRQVVRPGEQADPLAIGEGPLPIPLGQKRERIVARFDATLPPAGEGFPKRPDAPEPPKWIDETHQLLLKPKRGTQEARDYKEVRIWYRKQDLLPRLAVAVHKDGSTTELLLTNMQVNKPLPKTAFDTSTPKGWAEQIEDFRRANADEQ